jgi:integrase
MALTDTAVRNAKARDKAAKLTDGAGMYLLVQPTGGRLWRLDYRIHGKRKTLALGAYPTVTLADARERREAARRALAAGQDPGALRKLEKRTARLAAVNTFEAIGREWVAKLEGEGKAPATLAKVQWLLDFAYPIIGRRPIAEISAPDLLEVLRLQEKRGRLETARRLRSTCGQVFRYAIVTGRTERDPSADLRGALTAPSVKHRAAVTDPRAIGELLRAIDGFSGQPTTLAALRLMPLTLLRPGELRHAGWSEVDLDAAIWRVPGERMKMRAPHLVPLSRQAVEVLRDLHAITGSRQLIFPGLRGASRPMSENTINAALRRLGYAKDEMTGHGFRAMAATRLNEMGRWNPDAIERQLAHAENNKVRKAYTHAAQYLEERRTMLQAWADYLDALRQAGEAAPRPRASYAA